MTDTLSLSRAARLANVSRSNLQQRLRELDIEMFEGTLQISDLLKAYPQIDLDSDPVLERIAHIREEAFSKRGRTDTRLPEAEILLARLHDFQTVLLQTKASLNATQQLTLSLTDELERALQQDDTGLRQQITKLLQRLQTASSDITPTSDREAAVYAKDALLSLMSALVTVSPSRHEFFVSGQDSILEAGLKAGLNLEYGCTSGNCGKCKIRVRKGQVKPVRDYDYIFSASEQEQGYVLACSNTAVSDLWIEATEARIPQDLPWQQVRAKVKQRSDMGNHLLLDVQTARTKTLRFMAGQRVRLTSDTGVQIELPVASCPCDARNLQFLLPRKPAADFLDSLAQHEQPTVLIEGPFGDFVLQDESANAIIFVSIGDGIASMKSLIEHAISIDNAATLHLFRSDDLPHGSRISNLLRSWDDALDNFSYIRLAENASPQQVLQEIRMRFPSLADCQLYTAAPPAWLEEFRRQFSGNTTKNRPAGMHWEQTMIEGH